MLTSCPGAFPPIRTGLLPEPYAPKTMNAPGTPEVCGLRVSRHRSPRRNKTLSPGCKGCEFMRAIVFQGVLEVVLHLLSLMSRYASYTSMSEPCSVML